MTVSLLAVTHGYDPLTVTIPGYVVYSSGYDRILALRDA